MGLSNINNDRFEHLNIYLFTYVKTTTIIFSIYV